MEESENKSDFQKRKNGVDHPREFTKVLVSQDGAMKVANCLVEGQIRTIRGRVGAEDRDQHHGSDRSRGRSTRFLICRTVTESSLTVIRHTTTTEEGHAKEKWSSLVSGSTGKVPGLTQQKFEDRWRPGTWLGKAERSEKNLIADAEGVHIARSLQRRLVHHRCWVQNVKELIGTPGD